MREFNYQRVILVFLCFLTLNSCKPNPPRPTAVSKTETKNQHTSQNDKPSLFYEVRQPTTVISHPPVLILLHGYGSNEKDLFSFAPAIPGDYLVVCPQGPIKLGDNKYSWYPLNLQQVGSKYKAEDVLETSQLLIRFIKEIKTKYNIADDGIYIGGFSQGAITTLSTALLNPDDINGIVCLSGELYPEIKSQIQKSSALPHIFISHGTNDKVLEIQNIEEALKFLKDQGYKVTYKKYDAAHTITQQNLTDLINWLSQQRQS